MNAALMNGTMGHIFDFDDDHRGGRDAFIRGRFPARLPSQRS